MREVRECWGLFINDDNFVLWINLFSLGRDMDLTMSDVTAAAGRIKSFINTTPVMTSQTINRMCGRNVFFKCENFQKTGSFKVRGALNAVSNLSIGFVH